MFDGLNFLGAVKKKPDDKPATPPVKQTKPAVSPSALPKWVPLAVGAVGIVIVIGILMTAKGSK